MQQERGRIFKITEQSLIKINKGRIIDSRNKYVNKSYLYGALNLTSSGALLRVRTGDFPSLPLPG
jgi:hypothetical protein